MYRLSIYIYTYIYISVCMFMLYNLVEGIVENCKNFALQLSKGM